MLLKPHELSKLAEKFASSCLAQAREMRQGSVAKGNRFAKKGSAVFKKLREQGNAGRDALVPLLKHDDTYVKINTAACLLRYKNKEAMEVLRHIADGVGLLAFGAQQ